MKNLSFTTRLIIFMIGIGLLGGVASVVVDWAFYISIGAFLGVLCTLGYKLYIVLFSGK